MARSSAGWPTPHDDGPERGVPALIRRLSLAIGLSALVALATLVAAGEILSQPAHHRVGPPPADMRAEEVRIPLSPSGFVSGWLVPVPARSGVVLLVHGLRSDRLQMLARARFLNAAGYAVLLIDLPSHGESTGDRITFGLREGRGVEAALDFLHRRFPQDRVGVIGVSLGAASLVLSHPARTPDAVVLESMYPTLREAVADRLAIRMGAAGTLFTPLLLAQLPLRLDTTEDHLRPISAVLALGAPVLIASGTEDRHTTWPETERIFAAAAEPKSLWAVAGAAHVDLHAYAPHEYERRILDFLGRYLRP